MPRGYPSVLWLFFLLAGLPAHDDLGRQIAAVTRQIEGDPGNGELHLWRAELFRFQGDFDKSLADYERAHKLDSTLALAFLGRGKLFSDHGKTGEALADFDRYLALRPGHGEALLCRARARAGAGRPLDAAADYTAHIGAAEKPQPEAYLERAQALSAAGPAHKALALAGLDEGIAKLGALITLGEFALRLEVETGQYGRALRRLEGIMGGMNRKEEWFCRKGEILLLAGRSSEAAQAFEMAIGAVEGLPPRHRETAAVRALRERVEQGLKKTKGTP